MNPMVNIQAIMQKLNLPPYDFRQKEDEEGKSYIFDPFRKKYLLLTPEEWVRQNFARYLTEEFAYPASVMMTEVPLKLNQLSKRCDILVYGRAGNPVLLVECKAPGVKITAETFDQAARYNIVFRVSWLLVTNGMQHYCCYIDYENKKVEFRDSIPHFSMIDL